MQSKSYYPNPAGNWRRILIVLSLLFTAPGVYAQLVADFSVDRSSGCAPLSVLFTNKTSGASVNARYSWDFGNGNSSTLKSPGATYRDAKTYTVTLKVTDGGQTATKTLQVQVYKNPTVAFTMSPAIGCEPLLVNFQSQVHPGDGAITSLIWDFGDGSVQKGGETAKHTYSFPQKATVSLTVTNEFGCFTSVEKPAAVQISKALSAEFSADKTLLCNEGDAVQFKAKETGTDLTYSWDFGDGTKATGAAPKHVYAKKGTFTVKLKVSNSTGCVAEKEAKNYINVASATSTMQVPQAICAGSSVTFKAVTQPAADSVIWNLGDGRRVKGTSASTTFTTPGTRTVSFTAYRNGCPQHVQQTVNVGVAPTITGFIKDISALCKLPGELRLQDTTKGAVEWKWKIGDLPELSGQNAVQNITKAGTYPVQLTVTTASGCEATFTDTIIAGPPQVSIKAVNTAGQGLEGCEGMKLSFSTNSSTPLASYQWSFGDGGTATGATAAYAFNKSGRYTVTLNYTTVGGCSGSVTLSGIAVFSKPRIDFVGPTEACSSNPVMFKAITDTAVQNFHWYFGNSKTETSTSPNREYKFMDPGFHTVTLIANSGSCADTVTKKDYIKLAPPFQYLEKVVTQCKDDRNQVSFPVFADAQSMVWDFGDGQTQTITDMSGRKTYPVAHRYDQPGKYKAIFKSYYDGCEAVDSVSFYVSPKEKPQISMNKELICPTDTVTISLKVSKPYEGFSLNKLQYADGSAFAGKTKVVSGSDKSVVRILAWNFNPEKSGLRAIIQWNLSGCQDTSDLVSVKYSALKATIEAAQTAICLGEDLTVNAATEGKIVSWNWNMGNGVNFTKNEAITYRYNAAGTYKVGLTVTGEDGCVAQATSPNLKVVGVKADFTLADTVAGVNVATQFTNKSVATPSGAMQYQWLYADGKKAASTNLSYTYKNVGTDSVSLIARTTAEGCADTVTKAIRIVNFNARFSYEAEYINGNGCPPMLVKFKNLSKGSSKNKWDFGDGSNAQNQDNPEHVYNTGGTYTITLYTYGKNNTVDSASETITVKGPSATITADKFSGCLDQKVTLTAKVQYAKDYYWDFGDGTIKRTLDTFALHHYQTAGIYKPALIMTDSLGCSVGAGLDRPIVIDSLHLGITQQQGIWCDSATVSFQPRAVSVAADLLGLPLSYRWQTADAQDTTASVQFGFKNAGKHQIRLIATSAFGCVQEVVDTVVITPRIKGAIAGDAQVCVDQNIQFTANVPAAATGFQWVLPNGFTGTALQSPAQAFRDSGMYNVQLVVNNNGCYDTAVHKLKVNGLPKINIARRIEQICKGQSVQLTATGGTTYRWEGMSSSLGEGGTQSQSITASPLQTTWYKVFVQNAAGCQSIDSVLVKVNQPIKISMPAEAVVCAGSELTLEASGAATYQWSGPANTLLSQTGAKVVAKPFVNSVYTVVGTDSARCFSDSAKVAVKVAALPTVKTGPDQVLLTGSEITLSAMGSNDVVSYQWYPADYLSCTNCQQPVAQPRKAIDYTVTAKNQFGCIAKDTLSITLQCTDSRVFIPNAFTPDNNGLNETFSIKGRGIALVKSMRIYDRWGGLVFQSNNTSIDDRNAAWNGMIGSVKAPTGSYAYVAELICDTGEPILKKGTVTLIR